MNTICLYTFWNAHEPKMDRFDFTGQNDIREFIRLCGKNDMKVILRPGPYVCAEWEMGGLPWWLLKKKDIRLREQDPFLWSASTNSSKRLPDRWGDLTIADGRPIIMVQVENEYGSYGTDRPIRFRNPRHAPQEFRTGCRRSSSATGLPIISTTVLMTRYGP